MASRTVWRSVTVAVWAALLALASGAFAQVEAYRLGPGDKVRAQIIGLGNQTYVATVDASGRIRVPYLGQHRAAGKTLDELTQDIVLDTAGQQIQLVVDGVERLVVLDESDVFLDMDTYRPVTVTGLVASPGRVAFEPGMSARTAIGSAGGAAFLGPMERADQLVSLRAREAELRQTEAWLLADLWRIAALLENAPADAPPNAFANDLRNRLTDEERATVSRRIENARAELEREREDIEARIELTRQRIEFLETALEQFQTASDIEEARLRDILSLSERGLATANALDNAREGALNASSRLLTTQADLAEAERDLQSLSLQKRGLRETLAGRLLEEKTRAERDLSETRARLASLRQELALGSLLLEEQVETELRILLHRIEDGEENSREISPSTFLQPGDVVEVLTAHD